MVSDSLEMLSLIWLNFHGKQGSGPKRVKSPVEWEEIPFMRPLLHLSVHPQAGSWGFKGQSKDQPRVQPKG